MAATTQPFLSLKVGDPHAPAEPGLKVPPNAQANSLSGTILTRPSRTAQRLSDLLKVKGYLKTRDHAQRILCISPRFTLIQADKAPRQPLLCGGAGGLPAAPREPSGPRDLLPSGAGLRLVEEGVLVSYPLGLQLPSHLASLVLRAYSEYGKGGAGPLGGCEKT